VEDEYVGKVIHFFDKIKVAVLDLEKSLKIGDEVRFVKGNEEFTQQVASMEVDNEAVEEGKAGVEVAVKVEKPVKNNWKVFRVK